jgi:hypothetical protein
VDGIKTQPTAHHGRVVLADFSLVFVKALAGGIAVSVVAAAIVLGLAGLAG